MTSIKTKKYKCNANTQQTLDWRWGHLIESKHLRMLALVLPKYCKWALPNFGTESSVKLQDGSLNWAQHFPLDWIWELEPFFINLYIVLQQNQKRTKNKNDERNTVLQQNQKWTKNKNDERNNFNNKCWKKYKIMIQSSGNKETENGTGLVYHNHSATLCKRCHSHTLEW